ncbi:hypothetical protein SO02S_25180 [Salmonella enterica subsp. enterica serovar Oranienburg]|nr:hypothetical protein SO02S_25180 [Salmonella enterica subsp. enterica serovar Oranienburg]BDT42207.1 hypothetical protein SE2072C2_25060 [Salmonella enterica]
MVNDDQIQVIKLTTGKDRGKLFDNREGKNFINHYAILLTLNNSSCMTRRLCLDQCLRWPVEAGPQAE